MQVKDVLERAADKFGRVDGVCDCAGSSLIKPAHLTSAEEFHDAIAQNVLTAFNILKASVGCSLKLLCLLGCSMLTMLLHACMKRLCLPCCSMHA